MSPTTIPATHRSTRRAPGPRRAALSLTLALSALATLGASCASDDGGGLNTAACDAAVDYGAAFAEAPEEPAEFKSYAAERLMPIGEVLERHLSGDAKKAATTMRAAFAKVAETGDPAALEEPTNVAARSVIGKAVHNGCGLQKVDVRAIEYVYKGAPETLQAGRVGFAMKNEGVEEHEMVLFKRAEGVTESLDELLELPEEEMGAKLAFTGVTFGAPKTTNYVAVDLEPGTYFLICFIPQAGNDGPPHFMAGMKETIVVS